VSFTDYRYRGRHRAPSSTGRTVARVATVGVVAASPVALTEPAWAGPAGGWDPVIECESGGQNIENDASTASGYFQFLDGTWRTFGGTEFAPRAIDANEAEQTIVAERAFAANGLSDWAASRPCWAGKIGKHTSGTEAPRHAAQSAARHATEDRTHTVKRGDTLNKIAARHHTSVAAIVAANPSIHDPDRIFPGQQFHV
jgi:hypothetical protein